MLNELLRPYDSNEIQECYLDVLDFLDAANPVSSERDSASASKIF